jgi:NAD(P)-dependent dehydrogenase (short-subunit alcohol dehydrogenase family)/acyl carrier protein
MAPGGVLLELGKRDIWSPEEIAAARPDVRYHIYDSGQMVEAAPSFFEDFARTIVPDVASGKLPALKVEKWPLSRAAEAFRTMAQARHVGKLVLMPDEKMPCIRHDATYLISGGLGGLGLFTASWLADRGARHLLLVGRSAPSEDARSAVTALQGKGVAVRVALADVTDESAMRKLFEDAAASGAPIRGIVHAAGETRGGTLRSASSGDFARARHGKVDGAKTLHRLAQPNDLDFFILYSAAGVMLGAPGQGAYVSANAELDALAARWRNEGMRATSIAWGAWSEAGMFAALPEHARAAWRERGVHEMTAAQGFAALESFLQSGPPYGVIARVDWQRFFACQTAQFGRSIFETFAPRGSTRATASAGASAPVEAIAAIKALPLVRRRAALEDIVADRVSSVIGLDQRLPSDAPLKDSGLDSLMAVELRNVLARLGGVPLPATLALDFPSIAAIAEKLETVWALASPPAVKSASVSTEAYALSEAAAEAELEAELLSIASRRF